MQKFAEGNTVARLWNQDNSLWPAEEHQISSVKTNLQWLNLPDQIAPYMDKVTESARAVQTEGMDHVVFVAMGGSNLAGATVLDSPEMSARRQMFLLDSTDPDAIRDVESQLPLERTIFAFLQQVWQAYRNPLLAALFSGKVKACRY